MSAPTKIQRFDYLFERFQQAGKALYLVGGCVRDMLMGKPPKDYDFTTDATPHETRHILRAAKLRAVPVGEAFGTIATSFAGWDVEITTFRVKESYTKGSRHPQVVFGKDLVQDLSRRDLTINAMALDQQGQVVDPFGGQADLEAGILRAPGGGLEKTQEIFADDPLRMLRVARFMARYGFDADDATSAAAQACAQTLLNVSRERWQMETLQILRGGRVEKAIRWLEAVGVLSVYLPEVVALGPQSLSFSLAVISVLEPEPLWRWAALLQGLGAEGADAVCLRLKFSNKDRELVGALLQRQALFDDSTTDALPTRTFCRRLIVEAKDALPGLLALLDARAQVHGGEINIRVQARLQAFKTHAQALLADFGGEPAGLIPKLPTGLGHALIEQAGVARNADLRKHMDWLREQVLLERLPNPPSEAQCIAATRYRQRNPNADADLPPDWESQPTTSNSP